MVPLDHGAQPQVLVRLERTVGVGQRIQPAGVVLQPAGGMLLVLNIPSLGFRRF